MTESLVTTGLRALVRSRLAVPPGPPALLRVVREAARSGTNLATLLGVAAARWPHRTALIDDDGPINYRELLSRTEALANELRSRGAGRGQAVGILCRNGRGFVEAAFATAMVGADVVLLNTDFQGEALAAAMDSHKIEMMVCDDEFAERVAGDVTVIDPASVEARDERPKVASAGRIVLLTSGTTGTPKGVPRKPEVTSSLGVGASLLDRTGLRTGSRIAVPVPMFHGLGFGTLVLAIGLGGTVLTRRRFDAEATLSQASEHGVDAMTVVPVMLARIMDLPDEVRARNPLTSLRVVISSGARLEPDLARRFMDAYGDIIYNGYGSSEVGIGTLATPADLREAPETVGRPVVGCAVRILDENGAPVGPDVTGRVFVGSKLTFDAYTGGETKDVVSGHDQYR
jgi:acyl-CoA synthetase (AMP-forming)/AMP-acid ligase II